MQTHQRENLVAEAQNFALIHSVNFLVSDARNFNDGGEWNGKEAAADPEKQRLNASESQRDAKLESGAAAFLRADVDRSLETIHYRAHDVHADAAAGNFGDFYGSAEARLKNQIEGVLFAHALRFFRFDDAFLHGARANKREIDAPAIVTNFDHNLGALMIGIEINGATSWLSSCKALLGRANAVIDGVSNEMHQRLG